VRIVERCKKRVSRSSSKDSDGWSIGLTIQRDRRVWQCDGLQIRRLRQAANLEEVIRLKPSTVRMDWPHSLATHGVLLKKTLTRIATAPKNRRSSQCIIENYVSLKRKLIEEGHRFTTETDTEVLPIWSRIFLKTRMSSSSLEECVRRRWPAEWRVALAVIPVDEPDKIVAAPMAAAVIWVRQR